MLLTWQQGYIFFPQFSDGSGRSGVFVVLYSQLERLKTEHVVDVFQGIKAARTQRMGIVHNVVWTHVRIKIICCLFINF